MFVRYADNILDTGVPSFNSGCGATYGLTSPAFLGIVLPIRAVLTAENPVLTVLYASTLSALVFLVLLILMINSCTDEVSASIRRFIIVVTAFSILYDAENISVHFMSGMDTMLALAFLTAFILLTIRSRKTLTVFSAIITGLLGGLAFSFRPDLLIFSFAVPMVILVCSSGNKAGIHAGVILTVTALVVILQILFFWKYLNSPLPLPFYAKSIGYYGVYLQEMYKLFPIKRLIKFIFSFPFLFSAMGIALFIDIKGLWRRISDIGKGLFFATLLFIGYHLFFVTPIMDYFQRFYYPALPAILFLSIQCMKFICERTSFVEIVREKPLGKINSKTVKALFVLFPVFAFGPAAAEEAYDLFFSCKDEYTGFDVTEEYRARWTGYWFRLDEFSELPDNLVIAATEVGHPLAMNPFKTVIDMTGLNETKIAHSGFSADSFFHYYQPDLIFMPHPDYQDMIQSINENSSFINHYEVYSGVDLSTTLALAIRKDSEYYQQMRQIVSENIQSSQ